MGLEELKAKIRDVPDFPEPGIVFKDMMPLLADSPSLRETTDLLADWAEPRRPDVILGAEARGFILGAALAYKLGCGFVAARRPGKLPWNTVSASYALEYGENSLELHADAITHGARVLVHDDVLATGGTARAICDLATAARRRDRRGRVRDRAGLPRGAQAPRGLRRALPDHVLALTGSVRAAD